MYQCKIDHNLIQKILGKWSCPNCDHVFTEQELRYSLSDKKDNQNCPKCNHLIT